MDGQADHRQTGLAVGADVVGAPGLFASIGHRGDDRGIGGGQGVGEGLATGAGGQGLDQLLLDQLAEAFVAVVAQDELQAGLGPVLAVAVLVVDADHGLDQGDQVLLLAEGADDGRRLGRRAEASTGDHAEALLAVLDDGGDAHVLDVDLTEVVLVVAGEGDLELARQGRGERPAQEVLERVFLIGIDGERFIRQGADARAAAHRTHRVAAGLAGGQTGLLQRA